MQVANVQVDKITGQDDETKNLHQFSSQPEELAPISLSRQPPPTPSLLLPRAYYGSLPSFRNVFLRRSSLSLPFRLSLVFLSFAFFYLPSCLFAPTSLPFPSHFCFSSLLYVAPSSGISSLSSVSLSFLFAVFFPSPPPIGN